MSKLKKLAKSNILQTTKFKYYALRHFNHTTRTIRHTWRLDSNQLTTYKERKLIMNLDINKIQYLCSWEDVVEIHTRESLYEQYKDSNLYDDDNNDWGFDNDDNYDLTFPQILDKFDALFEVGEWHLYKQNAKRVQNDNMIIQRIW